MDKILEHKIREAVKKRKGKLNQESYEASNIERQNLQIQILKAIEAKEQPTEFKINNLPKTQEIKGTVEVANLEKLNGMKVEIANPEMKVTNWPNHFKIAEAIDINEPAWYKAVDEKGLARKIALGFKEILKTTIIQISADRHKLPSNALAVKIVDEKGRYVNMTPQAQQLIRAGGGGDGGGTTGGALETTQQLVLAELQNINASQNVYVDNEIPNGNIDGVNTTFTTHYNYKPGTTKVFLNGMRQREGVVYDYYENGTNEIEFAEAPSGADTIIIDYIKN
jgi:hypothetical protein